VSLLAGEFTRDQTILVDVDEQNDVLTFHPQGAALPLEALDHLPTHG
jgi:hypothetical protein